MLIVHMPVHVRPDCVEVFQRATLANARAGLKEPGVARTASRPKPDNPMGQSIFRMEFGRTPACSGLVK